MDAKGRLTDLALESDAIPIWENQIASGARYQMTFFMLLTAQRDEKRLDFHYHGNSDFAVAQLSEKKGIYVVIEKFPQVDEGLESDTWVTLHLLMSFDSHDQTGDQIEPLEDLLAGSKFSFVMARFNDATKEWLPVQGYQLPVSPYILILTSVQPLVFLSTPGQSYFKGIRRLPANLLVCVRNDSLQKISEEQQRVYLAHLGGGNKKSIVSQLHGLNEKWQLSILWSADNCALMVVLRGNEQFPFDSHDYNGMYVVEDRIKRGVLSPRGSSQDYLWGEIVASGVRDY